MHLHPLKLQSGEHSSPHGQQCQLSWQRTACANMQQPYPVSDIMLSQQVVPVGQRVSMSGQRDESVSTDKLSRPGERLKMIPYTHLIMFNMQTRYNFAVSHFNLYIFKYLLLSLRLLARRVLDPFVASPAWRWCYQLVRCLLYVPRCYFNNQINSFLAVPSSSKVHTSFSLEVNISEKKVFSFVDLKDL